MIIVLISILLMLFNFITSIFSFIRTPFFIIGLLLLVILYHLLSYGIRDRSYINKVLMHKDLDTINLEDLDHKPHVNIIIPAWKEGDEFEDLLFSITKLSYPNIKVIVNAGGNEKTIDVANSYKSNPLFTIIYQKGGKSRAALGKIKALNQCLDYVKEGVVYLIDADCYITDDLLLRMLYPITNKNEKVVIGAGIKPLKSQQESNLSRYLEISINRFFKEKFARYFDKLISGANTMITYDVMRTVGKFNEDRNIAEDVSRGIDIQSKGYKIFSLVDYRSRIATDFPKSLKELFKQRNRQIENTLILSYRRGSVGYILKFMALYLASIIVAIFPLFLIYNLGIFSIGVSILLFMYIKKIRAYIFYNKTNNSLYYTKFRAFFFIQIVFYIYIEMLHNLYIPIDLIVYKMKNRRTQAYSGGFQNNNSLLSKPISRIKKLIAHSSSLNTFILKLYYKSILYRKKHTKNRSYDWLKKVDLQLVSKENAILYYQDLKILLSKNSLDSIPLHQKYLYAYLISYLKIPSYYLLFWDDLVIFHEFYIEKLYDKIFEAKKGDIIFDIGSSIGWYALKMAKKVGEEGKIIAIEPDTQNYYNLKKNVELNNLRNVSALNIGVWSSKNNLFLKSDKYASFLNVISSEKTSQINEDSILVNVNSLDNIIEELNLDKVDLIKMDIEGAEIQAIQGAEKLLASSQNLKLIIAAYHPTKTGKKSYEIIVPYLKKLKFEVYQQYLPYIYAQKREN